MSTEDKCTQSGDFPYRDRKEDIIGKGSTSAIVFRGNSMSLVIAVKRIVRNHERDDFISEIEEAKTADNNRYQLRKINNTRKITGVEILREILHQDIIRIHNFKYIEAYGYICIPMELCNENLYQYCERIDDYDIEIRLNILKQIGEGIKHIKYLHSTCHSRHFYILLYRKI